MELRHYKRVGAPEIRSVNGQPVLTGAFAVFRSYSQNLGGFVEIIEPGAFDGAIAAQRDQPIAGVFNHDANQLLGMSDNGTVTLTADGTAARYDISLNMKDPTAIGVAEKVSRGDLRGSSFQFSMPPDGSGESWSLTDQGFPLRTISRVGALYDVGPVTWPAYRATTGDGMAAALRSLALQVDRPIEELVAAAGRNELRSLIPSGSLPTVPDPTPSHGPSIELLRRRLALRKQCPV